MPNKTSITDRLAGRPPQRIRLVLMGGRQPIYFVPGQNWFMRLRLFAAGRFVLAKARNGHEYWKCVEVFGRVVSAKSWPSKKWTAEIRKEAEERWPHAICEL